MGFGSLRDVLDVLLVPLALAILSLAWPGLQARFRRRQFQTLIFRELSELAPYPVKAKSGGSWWEHARPYFVHRELFLAPSENRELLLSLDANLTYLVSQLWSSYAARDAQQWLYLLLRLSDAQFGHEEAMRQIQAQWATLLAAYGVMVSQSASSGDSSDSRNE